MAIGSDWTSVSEIVFCFLETRNIFSSPCADCLWVLGHLRWGALVGVLRWICRRCIQLFWKEIAEKNPPNFIQTKRIHLMQTYTGILLTTFDGNNIYSYIKWQEMNRRMIWRRELQDDVSWLVFLRSVSKMAILPYWCQDNTVIWILPHYSSSSVRHHYVYYCAFYICNYLLCPEHEETCCASCETSK